MSGEVINFNSGTGKLNEKKIKWAVIDPNTKRTLDPLKAEIFIPDEEIKKLEKISEHFELNAKRVISNALTKNFKKKEIKQSSNAIKKLFTQTRNLLAKPFEQDERIYTVASQKVQNILKVMESTLYKYAGASNFEELKKIVLPMVKRLKNSTRLKVPFGKNIVDLETALKTVFDDNNYVEIWKQKLIVKTNYYKENYEELRNVKFKLRYTMEKDEKNEIFTITEKVKTWNETTDLYSKKIKERQAVLKELIPEMEKQKNIFCKEAAKLKSKVVRVEASGMEIKNAVADIINTNDKIKANKIILKYNLNPHKQGGVTSLARAEEKFSKYKLALEKLVEYLGSAKYSIKVREMQYEILDNYQSREELEEALKQEYKQISENKKRVRKEKTEIQKETMKEIKTDTPEVSAVLIETEKARNQFEEALRAASKKYTEVSNKIADLMDEVKKIKDYGKFSSKVGRAADAYIDFINKVNTIIFSTLQILDVAQIFKKSK